MLELQGKHNTAKVFTDNIDSATISQIIDLLNQDFIKESQIRIMPDWHAGKGCVIGTTMTITDKIVPNLVGVDIGCLSCDTEILTPNGWIKISEYNNEQILVFDTKTNTAFYEQPKAYIKKPEKYFYHIKSRNLDQMVSKEHTMLIYRGYKSKGRKMMTDTAKNLIKQHNTHPKSNRTIKTTFNINQPDLPISDNMLRILVMISADGTTNINKDRTTHVHFHFKKQRKIERAKQLLFNEGLRVNEQCKGDHTHIYTTIPYPVTKSLKQFYRASFRQLKIIIDEIYHWDGTIDTKRNHKNFSSNDKTNADVIQFAHNATGTRAGICKITYPTKPNWNPTYTVYETNNEYVSLPDKQIDIVKSVDGYKYCFTTSTGFFIIRRNNCISITGNCSVSAIQLEETDIDLAKLDKTILEYVPSGFKVHEHAIATSNIKDMIAPVDIEFAYKSLGTLGGGNHFLEVNRDTDGHLWLVIHTGSRHLGLEIAKHYQELGYKKIKSHDIKSKIDATIAQLKAAGKERDIENTIKVLKMQEPHIPKDLCYVTGQDFDDYLHDIKLAQNHARINHQTIADIIVSHMNWHIKDTIHTMHNYIDTENKILRKGAVSAQKNERLIIPINMRDGSLICIGKGNPDWNYSAPHGAGRILSRGQAKDNISMDDFKETMRGIYSTSVTESTLDEAPMAYKPMDEIVQNIQDTVEIVHVIKPIYNFKAH